MVDQVKKRVNMMCDLSIHLLDFSVVHGPLQCGQLIRFFGFSVVYQSFLLCEVILDGLIPYAQSVRCIV